MCLLNEVLLKVSSLLLEINEILLIFYTVAAIQCVSPVRASNRCLPACKFVTIYLTELRLLLLLFFITNKLEYYLRYYSVPLIIGGT